jgi:hypothetical protein
VNRLYLQVYYADCSGCGRIALPLPECSYALGWIGTPDLCVRAGEHSWLSTGGVGRIHIDILQSCCFWIFGGSLLQEDGRSGNR